MIMSNIGKLDLIIGPMFSGKSSEIIRRIRNFKISNKKYIVIKPSIDNRYELNKIISHNNDSETCIMIDDIMLITDIQLENYDIIIIDEGQFFKNLKDKVLHWVEKLNKYIIIGGLDSDFLRNPIGDIIKLIPYADDYIKLKATCNHCIDGTKAIFSHKFKNKSKIVEIGEHNLYIPLCRKHYLEANKKDKVEL